MAETTYSDDLLIKHNTADMIVNITAVDYEGNEKSVMVLFDSNDNWEHTEGDSNLAYITGALGASVIRVLQEDARIKMYLVQFFLIINGKSEEYLRLKPFVRDGKRFRQAIINANEEVTFLEEDEI